LAVVGSTFKSAAESDAVWERFLPSHYRDIITRAVDFPNLTPSSSFASKKQLYLWLSNHPLLIDQGTKLHGTSQLYGATHPAIGDGYPYPSPGAYGFEYQPTEVAVGVSGSESETQSVYLDPEGGQRLQYQIVPRNPVFRRSFSIGNRRRQRTTSVLNGDSCDRKYPKARGDGWMEIEMGEYFNKGGGGEDEELEMSVMEVERGDWKSGLIVQGIEIRPKSGFKNYDMHGNTQRREETGGWRFLFNKGGGGEDEELEMSVMEVERGDWKSGLIVQGIEIRPEIDACRLAVVGSTFKSAGESDAVWERFLPSHYKDIITRAVDFPNPTPSSPFASKKQLYLWLSDHPLLIDQGTMSFSLEKSSGRICYMLAARNLAIVWGDTPSYWRWISIPESRFSEVAELINVCWLEIRGKINTSMLSPNTTYAAFFVFKSTADAYGFEYHPTEVAVGVSGSESETQSVYLDPERGQRLQFQIVPRKPVFRRGFGISNRWRQRTTSVLNGESCDRKYPKVRGDGWMEIEMGEYFNKGGGGEDEELEMSVMEVERGDWKSGLIVQGIEIRPKVVDK
ncbi:hypothetical protein C3L33_16909, partial [Rhododendron williamsianum]